MQDIPQVWEAILLTAFGRNQVRGLLVRTMGNPYIDMV